jgi:DNA mismatch repair protein MutS2
VRGHAPVEVDLHGLRVDEALLRIDDALDAALRAGHAELRFIHGRSGGRLRGALHERLRRIAAVRGVRLDPRNAGVTIVSL